MTKPTIICPNRKTKIKLTESLAAPLIESTRKQFEQHWQTTTEDHCPDHGLEAAVHQLSVDGVP